MIELLAQTITSIIAGRKLFIYILFRSTFSNTSGLRCSAARYLHNSAQKEAIKYLILLFFV